FFEEQRNAFERGGQFHRAARAGWGADETGIDGGPRYGARVGKHSTSRGFVSQRGGARRVQIAREVDPVPKPRSSGRMLRAHPTAADHGGPQRRHVHARARYAFQTAGLTAATFDLGTDGSSSSARGTVTG